MNGFHFPPSMVLLPKKNWCQSVLLLFLKVKWKKSQAANWYLNILMIIFLVGFLKQNDLVVFQHHLCNLHKVCFKIVPYLDLFSTHDSFLLWPLHIKKNDCNNRQLSNLLFSYLLSLVTFDSCYSLAKNIELLPTCSTES